MKRWPEHFENVRRLMTHAEKVAAESDETGLHRVLGDVIREAALARVDLKTPATQIGALIGD